MFMQEGATLALVARSEDQLKQVCVISQWFCRSLPQTGMKHDFMPLVSLCTRLTPPRHT